MTEEMLGQTTTDAEIFLVQSESVLRGILDSYEKNGASDEFLSDRKKQFSTLDSHGQKMYQSLSEGKPIGGKIASKNGFRSNSRLHRWVSNPIVIKPIKFLYAQVERTQKGLSALGQVNLALDLNKTNRRAVEACTLLNDFECNEQFYEEHGKFFGRALVGGGISLLLKLSTLTGRAVHKFTKSNAFGTGATLLSAYIVSFIDEDDKKAIEKEIGARAKVIHKKVCTP